MPIDFMEYVLDPNLIVSDVNRDIDVVDQYETGSADGLITGLVTATVGSDGRTRYLPLILEVNPNIVKSYCDSYLPLLNADLDEHLVFSLTLGGGDTDSGTSWAKPYSVSRRELRFSGQQYTISCTGGPGAGSSLVYKNDGVIPDFFVSIDTSLADSRDGVLYSVTLDIYTERGDLLKPEPNYLMSKRYRLYRSDEEMLFVTTDPVNVGGGSYDEVDWTLADRENAVTVLPYS